jgi:acetone carboxylase alpha subunit
MPVNKRAHIAFAHPLAKYDSIDLIETEIQVTRKGMLELDFEGTTEWSFHCFNCGVGPMDGGLWITLTQLLAYDGRVNDGAYLGVRQYLPKGSIVNADYKGAASSLSWWSLIPAFSNIWRLLSVGRYASGFIEEIIMSTPTCTVGVTGFDQFGQPTGYQNFEMSAESGGARGVADGADCGSPIWNSEGMQGDAEIWEMTGPNLYLGRRFVPNHQGFGRFRGGQAWESLWMVHGSDIVNVTITASGCTNGGVFHKGLLAATRRPAGNASTPLTPTSRPASNGPRTCPPPSARPPACSLTALSALGIGTRARSTNGRPISRKATCSGSSTTAAAAMAIPSNAPRSK